MNYNEKVENKVDGEMVVKGAHTRNSEQYS